MYSKGDMSYPCIQEIRNLTPEQGNLIVEKNLANLKQGIDQLGIIMDLGNVYETIIGMKAARFPEILQVGNKKSIKSVDELLKILKVIQLEVQRINIMILLIN